MRGFRFSTVALAWLAACGPGRDADRTARERNVDTGDETGMRTDTGPAAAPGARGAVTDTGAMGGRRDTGGGKTSDTLDAAVILTTLATANMQEIQEAKYVRTNGTSPAVKTLAQKLETDHTANLRKIRTLAKQLGVEQQLPSDRVPSQGAPTSLQGMRGSALDTAFVVRQVEVHRANIDLIKSQMLPTVRDSSLKQYLQQTVTAMEGHLRQLGEVQRKFR